MGAWGTGLFQNDDAEDWTDELAEASELSPVRQALAATMDTDGYLERPEGACAAAAASVVAASLDGNLGGLPTEIVAWIGQHPDAATRGDARLALDALERVIGEDSELRDVWLDAADGERWARNVEALQQRLVRAIGD